MSLLDSYQIIVVDFNPGLDAESCVPAPVVEVAASGRFPIGCGHHRPAPIHVQVLSTIGSKCSMNPECNDDITYL